MTGELSIFKLYSPLLWFFSYAILLCLTFFDHDDEQKSIKKTLNPYNFFYFSFFFLLIQKEILRKNLFVEINQIEKRKRNEE